MLRSTPPPKWIWIGNSNTKPFVTSFDNEDEVINRANNSRYGLAATIWTQDVGRAHRVAQSLQCGTTWINCFLIRDLNMPFGGMKESGSGREGYPYSIDFFTELKTICVYHGWNHLWISKKNKNFYLINQVKSHLSRIFILCRAKTMHSSLTPACDFCCCCCWNYTCQLTFRKYFDEI